MNEMPLLLLADEELLARFITVEHWVRSSNQTVRPEAFIPPNDLQLSVTRHINLSEEELWNVGQKIADQVTKTERAPLCGRADLRVRQVSEQQLRTEAAPLDDNPNHAHIIGWPIEKSARKSVAQELAAKAELHRR